MEGCNYDALELLGFDFETTSPEPSTTGVIQTAAKWESGEVVLNELSNPGFQISDGAFDVHGISNEMIANKPNHVEVVKRLADYILEREGKICLVGHNITTFDVPIMWRVAGIKNPPRIPTIDTLTCAIRTLPHAENHKLGPLHVALGLGSAEKAHDALGDIEMVFNLVRKFREALGMTTAELIQWLETPRVLSTCHFGKHKGKPWGWKAGCVPAGYVRFICEKFDTPHPDLVATIKHHYGFNFRMA